MSCLLSNDVSLHFVCCYRVLLQLAFTFHNAQIDKDLQSVKVVLFFFCFFCDEELHFTNRIQYEFWSLLGSVKTSFFLDNKAILVRTTFERKCEKGEKQYLF